VTPGRTRSCRTCRCTLPGSTRSRSTSLSFGASSWSPPTSPTWTPSREDPGLRRPVQHRRGPVRLAIHPRRPEQPAPPHRRQGQRPRGSGSRMNGMMRTARLHQDQPRAATGRPRAGPLARTNRRLCPLPWPVAYITSQLHGGETLPLGRLRYGGSASSWGFAIYRTSHDDYQDSILPTGHFARSAEKALDCACGPYLADATTSLTS
jgi:hypothetical protein